MNWLKFTSYAVAIVVIVNFLLYAFTVIPMWLFWTVLAVCGLYAYKGMPYLKKKQS